MSSPTIVGRLNGPAAVVQRPALSPTALALRRFRAHRLAIFGTALLLLIVGVTISAPFIAPYDPIAVDLSATRRPPSTAHILGTDSTGRDVLSRLMHAAQVSLAVGLSAALLQTGVGLSLGLLAGYYRGWVDSVISRVTEIVLSYPLLIVIIVIVAILGPGQNSIILGIGLFGWPTACRIVRGLVFSLREQDFVLAARCIGVSDRRLISRHLLPLVVGPLTVTATFAVAYAVLLEASLSFLGLGIRPPRPSWGNMLNEAQSLPILESMPWLWLPPGAAIALTVLAINFVGDGLRDAVDPRQRAIR
ncbi:MAG TPA: oligopeptide ABC transporter permease [Candidatus Limnocylindria bacterium]|jgi:peptide/nickel transport system permease protein|nr:oligopeptide ABC transporter permease [Candidatus Limnocylindria bacterium]